MKQEELKKILEDHKLWLDSEEEEGARANLTGAYLRGANLKGADLYGAGLEGADLYVANLKGANLYGADLTGVNLRAANLYGADLYRADLRGSKNLPPSLIKYFQKDLLCVLQNSPTNEVVNLRAALIEGKINGTKYQGDCCCLIGTLAKSTNLETVESTIPFYTKGLHNPCEQLFYQIRKGDTPDNNEFAKIALETIDLVLNKKENK